MPGVSGSGRERSSTRDFVVVTCSVMGVVLGWSRLANLGTSFWSDEAYSAYYYANRGPRGIFFGTYVPNNHALYNLLSWATTSALGRFEASYRIWSVLPGIAAVALAAWWASKRLGTIAATAIVVLATVSPVHLVLTPQARGYGLAMLAGVAVLVTAVRVSDHASTRDVAWFAAAAIAGIWTLPVFALAAGFQAAVLVADRRVRKRMLVACGAIAAASLIFYAPMLGGILHNAGQKFGSRLALVGAVTGAYHDLAAPTIGNAIPTSPHALLNEVVTFAVIMLLALAAGVRLWRRHDRALLAHLAVPIFGTYVALVAGRFYVQPRFASYLLFHVVVLLAIGVEQVWDLGAGIAPARALVAFLVAGLAFTGTARVAALTSAQARTPWENEKFVASVAKATGLDYVFTDSRHPAALYYYLGAKNVELIRSAGVEQQTYCRVPSRFIFVDDTYHQTATPNLACLRERHAIRLDVPQQLAPPIRRPGVLTVYLVPAKKGLPKKRAKARAGSRRRQKAGVTTTTGPRG